MDQSDQYLYRLRNWDKSQLSATAPIFRPSFATLLQSQGVPNQTIDKSNTNSAGWQQWSNHGLFQGLNLNNYQPITLDNHQETWTTPPSTPPPATPVTTTPSQPPPRPPKPPHRSSKPPPRPPKPTLRPPKPTLRPPPRPPKPPKTTRSFGPSVPIAILNRRHVKTSTLSEPTRRNRRGGRRHHRSKEYHRKVSEKANADLLLLARIQGLK